MNFLLFSCSRGKLRDAVGLDLDDEKYAGKRVSRKALFDDDTQHGKRDIEYEEDEDSEAGLDSDEDVRQYMDMEADESDGEEDGSDEEEEEDEGDDDESQSDDGEGKDGEDNGDEVGDGRNTQARLAKELAQLEVEEKKLVKSMSASAKADADKGKHVRAQIVSFRFSQS